MKVAVSYLKSDNYKKCIELINDTSADFLHADLCDGKYVENKNFTIGKIVDTLKVSKKSVDIHLMVQNPLKYIDKLASLNVDTITIHLDSTSKPEKVIDYILSIGIKVGVALSPSDDIDILNPYIDKLDQIIILSVIPGKGGQAFMPEVIPKIEKLNEIKKLHHFKIEVDGGINEDTIKYLSKKDVDQVVSGSYITDSTNYDDQINKLKKLAD